MNPDGDERSTQKEFNHSRFSDSKSSPSSYETEFSWKVSEAILSSTFWLIIAAETLSILASGALSFHSVPYLEGLKLSKGLSAGALSLSVLLGAVVAPGWGYLSDIWSPRRLALIVLVITMFVTSIFLIAIFMESGRVGFLAVVLWGLSSGGVNILGQMMIAHYFGRTSYGSITGLTGPFQLVGLGLGPSLGALIFNLTGEYTILFLYAIGTYFLAIMFIYKARRPKLPQRAFAENSQHGSST